MAQIDIHGQAYQSSGDGGDVFSSISISEAEMESIREIAREKEVEIDELKLDDLPSDIRERMEDELRNDWEYSEGGPWNTFVSGFSIEE